MLFDADSVPHGGELEADVAIVGSGAAGLAALLGLHEKANVVVLESGGDGTVPSPDPLYEFQSRGLPIADHSRVRGWGGSTGVWAGRWRTLDPIDFIFRPWVPHSGWPITSSDLAPYYEQAAALLNGGWSGERDSFSRAFPLLADTTALEPSVFRFQNEQERNWGDRFRSRIALRPQARVYTNAHVTHLREANGRVEHLEARTPAGTRFFVRARFVILAAGGIENARLLLASNIGRELPVGRYYMDHPKGACGFIETFEPVESCLDQRRDGHRFWIALRVSDALQKRFGLGNSHIGLESVEPRFPHTRFLMRLFSGKSTIFFVRNYLEQFPDPDNRVELSDKLDTFGVPFPAVTWKVGERERDSLGRFHRILAEECERASVGHLVSPLLSGSKDFPVTQDASHHMGTTRMGTDPNVSVVDANCKIHGLANLFIAGPSIFPTGGSAGPTATIAALSLRLAEHLNAQL